MNDKKISINQVLQTAAAVPDRPLAGTPAPMPTMQQGQSIANPSSITSARQAATVAKAELAAHERAKR